MSARTALLLALMAVLLMPNVAAGHSVGADAWVEEDGVTVTVEAWFAGGRAPSRGMVIVSGEDGGELLRGDLVEGAFRFRAPVRQRFRFDVQLGEGHAKQFVLNAEEFARLRPTDDPGVALPLAEESARRPVAEATATAAGGATVADRRNEGRERTALRLGFRVLAGLVVISLLSAAGHRIATRKGAG